jgi:hypothetical protein
MTKQPEALRLAYLLEVSSDNPTLINVDKRCAAELRRLHEVNQELLEALQSLIDMDVAYQRGPRVEEAVEAARAAINKATGKQA